MLCGASASVELASPPALPPNFKDYKLQWYHVEPTRFPSRSHLPGSLSVLFVTDCNGIVSLPDWLEDFTSLYQLSINNCNIKTLPDTIQKLTYLQYLLIFGCPELGGWYESEENKMKMKVAHIMARVCALIIIIIVVFFNCTDYSFCHFSMGSNFYCVFGLISMASIIHNNYMSHSKLMRRWEKVVSS